LKNGLVYSKNAVKTRNVLAYFAAASKTKKMKDFLNKVVPPGNGLPWKPQLKYILPSTATSTTSTTTTSTTTTTTTTTTKPEVIADDDNSTVVGEPVAAMLQQQSSDADFDNSGQVAKVFFVADETN
jgi:hypothetical protein